MHNILDTFDPDFDYVIDIYKLRTTCSVRILLAVLASSVSSAPLKSLSLQ